MLFEEIVSVKPLLIEGIEPRIAHPEDLIWRKGKKGYIEAIESLKYIANNPGVAKIKFDGSPALIFGRDPESKKLVVTDKSGFGATKYNGFASSPKELFDLFYNRKPGDKDRQEFASKMASIWKLLVSIIPKDFQGFIKGDLLYSNTPQVINGYYYFVPNKIVYRVPVNSDLGQKIASSKAGIVVHGYIKDKNVTVPAAIDDVDFLKNSSDLLVIPSSSVDINKIKIPTIPNLTNIEYLDIFLNPDSLRRNQLADFGNIVGRYLGHIASSGSSNYVSAGKKLYKLD